MLLTILKQSMCVYIFTYVYVQVWCLFVCIYVCVFVVTSFQILNSALICISICYSDIGGQNKDLPVSQFLVSERAWANLPMETKECQHMQLTKEVGNGTSLSTQDPMQHEMSIPESRPGEV